MMQYDGYAEHTHTPTLEQPRLCIPLGTSLESLSSASLRNDFGASSPYISVVSKLCIPLGMTLELLHLLFRWYLSSASP
jgi:hypothetical protein